MEYCDEDRFGYGRQPTEDSTKPKYRHLFTLHIGAWVKFLKDVLCVILLWKLVKAF